MNYIHVGILYANVFTELYDIVRAYTYAKSAGNDQRVKLPATTSHHREVVSRGGHHAFVRPSYGCADAEAPVAGTHPANACRPPSVPYGLGAGPTSWTAIPAGQPLYGRALPTRRTSSASRRPPWIGTRHPIPLLHTGKPLTGTTPMMMMMYDINETSPFRIM